MSSFPLSLLLIRADASTGMGTGHIMRCLALAQAWQDKGGQAIFLIAAEMPVIVRRLKSEGMEVLRLSLSNQRFDDANQTIKVAQEHNVNWIVLDGYHFGSDYQLAIKKAGFKLLCFDDFGHAEHYYADVVLNQNRHASRKFYKKKEAYTRLLLGTSYVLLRREFIPWKNWNRTFPTVVKKVMVSLGGGDADNVTFKVIQSFEKLKELAFEITIVVGTKNPYAEIIREAVKKLSFPVHIMNSVENMSELMAWADLAVCGGGTTCWELAFLGVPMITLELAENQRLLVEELSRSGIAVNLGFHRIVKPEQIAGVIAEVATDIKKREVMSQRGRILVDGNGRERILEVMSLKSLHLRKARTEDCEMVWEWANDPVCRSASFNADFIPWGNHISWFQSKLNDKMHVFFIGEDQEGRPIGQVRFDIEGEKALISASLRQDFRGKGFGGEFIRMACEGFFKEKEISHIEALIKHENMTSKKAFERAGFKETGNIIHKGFPTLVMQYRKGAAE